MSNIRNMIPLTGELSPKHHDDDFTILDQHYVRGGYKIVSTIIDRDNIKEDRRTVDMIVEVLENQKRYTLKEGIANTDWKEISFDSASDIYNVAKQQGYAGTSDQFWKSFLDKNHLVSNSWEFTIANNQTEFILENSKFNNVNLFLCQLDSDVLIPNTDYTINNSVLTLSAAYPNNSKLHVREFLIAQDYENIISEMDDLIGSAVLFPVNNLNKDGYLLADGTVYERKLYPEYYNRFGYKSNLDTIKNNFPWMISNTTPSGFTVFYSSEYSSAYKSYFAFADPIRGWTSGTCWHSGSGAAHFLGITGTQNAFYKLKSYTLQIRGGVSYGNAASPKTWTLQGCTTVTGEDWEILDTRTNLTMEPGTEHTFEISDWLNKSFYAKFRIHITTSSLANYAALQQLIFNTVTKEDDENNKSFTIPDYTHLAPENQYYYIRVKSPRTIPYKGLDTYESALAEGFIGTQKEWLNSLKGESAYNAYCKETGFTGTEQEWLSNFQDLYTRAVNGGFIGSQNDFNKQLAKLGSNTPSAITFSNKVLIKRISFKEHIGKTIEIPINPNQSNTIYINSSLHSLTSPAANLMIRFNDGVPVTFTQYMIQQTSTTAVSGTTVTITANSDHNLFTWAAPNVYANDETIITYIPGSPLHYKQQLHLNRTTGCTYIKTATASSPFLLEKISIIVPNTFKEDCVGFIEVFKNEDVIPTNMHNYKELFCKSTSSSERLEQDFFISKTPLDEFIVECTSPNDLEILADTYSLQLPSKTKFMIQITNYDMSIDGTALNITSYVRPTKLTIKTNDTFIGLLRISKDVETHSISVNPDVITGFDINYENNQLHVSPGSIELDNVMYHNKLNYVTDIITIFDTIKEVLQNKDIYIYVRGNEYGELHYKASHTVPYLDRFNNEYLDISKIQSLGIYAVFDGFKYRALGKLKYINDDFAIEISSYKYNCNNTHTLIDSTTHKLTNISDTTNDTDYVTNKQIHELISLTGIIEWNFTSTNQTDFNLLNSNNDEAKNYLVIVDQKFMNPNIDYTIDQGILKFQSSIPLNSTVNVRCLLSTIVTDSPSKQVSAASKLYLYTTFPGGI